MVDWVNKYAVVGEANDSLAQMYGFEPKDMVGRPAVDFAPNYGERAMLVLEGEGYQVENEQTEDIDKDGKPLYLLENYHGIVEDGHLISIWGAQNDITERVQAEEALRTEKEFTDTALDAQLDTFFLFDPATNKALRWNRAFREVSGYTDEEIAEMPAPASYYNPEDLEQAGIFIQKVLKEGSGTIELELICKDGRKVSTEYRVSVINDDQGEPKYMISIGRDITERVRAEQAARQQAADTSVLFSVSQLLAQAPPDSNEVALIMARQFVDVLGLPEASLALYDPQNDTLRYLADYYDPKDVDPNDENWTGKVISMSDYPATVRVMETLESYIVQTGDPNIDPTTLAYLKEAGVKTMATFPMVVEDRFVGIIGLETWFEEYHYTQREIDLAMAMANQAAVALERAQLFETAQREISERMQAEEALRESEAKFRNVVDSSPMGVHMYRLESDDRLVFEGANHTADEILGVDNSQFIGKTIEEAFPPLAETEVPERYRRAATQGEPWFTEQITYEDEKITGAFEVHAFQTEPGKMVAMFLEITDRKQAEAEREKLISELESQNAELERFTYTVSHDLKSPLITITGFVGYLEEDATSGNMERLRGDIQRIQGAVEKMQRLLDELLELSRIGRLMNPPEEVPFEEIVNNALDNVHGQLEERGVAVTLGPNLPSVHGDRQRLVEVLQNLVDNAAKCMGEQSDPHIEIGQQCEEDGKPVFYVKDNGIGIAPEYHEKIFGLFEKLDAKTEGTGIGLALVKRIVEFHGGRIWVESAAGKGATFYFTLATQGSGETL
jgi:PAS domain S-box-containing protein